MWINVKDSPYNAQGDGTNDDTEEIQAAIDAAQEQASPDKRNAVSFPPGIYRVKGTLLFRRNQGVRLIGVGDVAGLPAYVGGYEDRVTGAVLFWDGAPGGTLLRIKGSSDGGVTHTRGGGGGTTDTTGGVHAPGLAAKPEGDPGLS